MSVSRTTTSHAYVKLVDQAKALAADGKLSTQDVDQLLDAAISDRTLSAPERAALKDLATQFACHMESPELTQRLKAFASMTHAGIRTAVRTAEKNDGVVDATEAWALAETLQQGKLNGAAKYTLAAVLVGARLTPEARDVLKAVKDGQPLPDNTPPPVDANLVQKLEASIRQEANTTYSTSAPPNMSPLGDKFFAGEWMGQAFNVAGPEGLRVILAHPDGRVASISGDSAQLYLTRPPQLQGRAVYEVMGNPPTGRRYGGNQYVFDAGTITYDPLGYGRGTTFKVGDVAARLEVLKDTPRSDLAPADAAAVLRKNFLNLVRAQSDSHSPFITLRDLEAAALDPNRSVDVRSAARSVLASGSFVAMERAGSADERITLADLDAVLAGTSELSTRPVQFRGLVAADYMDTTGSLATPVGRDRRLSLQLRAVPGAELTVQNAMVLDGNGLKTLVKHTVPMGDPGPDGMVDVNLPVPRDADWTANDRLEISQTVGSRSASAPVVVSVTGKFDTQLKRPAFLDEKKLTLGTDGWVKTTGNYAARPNESVKLIRNGVETSARARANAFGQFELKIPGSLSDGNWELRVGDKRKTLSGTPVDSKARAQTWVRDLNQVFLAAPRNNSITGEVRGLEPGYTVTLQNLASNAQALTFKADANGLMKVNVPNTAPGDVLHINYAAAQLADYSLPQVKFTVATPTPAQAERIAFVLGAINAPTERDRFFALELFGPHSTHPDFRGMKDPVRMQACLDGARMGAFLASRGFDAAWKTRITGAISQAGKSDVLAGMAVGEGYRGSHSPTRDADLGFKLIKEGETRTVVTGGYSPISGDHGPLVPEHVTGPGTYELNFLDLPPMRLETRGGQPSGWVNTNAHTFSLTLSVN